MSALEFLQHQSDFNDPEVASILDELSFWAARFGALLFDNLEIRSYSRILDVGYGTGFPLFELADVFGRSCQVVGVDVWPAGISRAKLKGKIYNVANAHLAQADGAHMPWPGATL
jgi:ubiquinone/menaquinone biosynthesis C-methylase UbiE